MLFQVEDFGVFFVDFFVAVWPDACFVEFEEGMHACSEKGSIVLVEDA